MFFVCILSEITLFSKKRLRGSQSTAPEAYAAYFYVYKIYFFNREITSPTLIGFAV